MFETPHAWCIHVMGHSKPEREEHFAYQGHAVLRHVGPKIGRENHTSV